jgi:hypothetical protein
MGKKKEQIKKHFVDNQKLYIGVGIGIVVTAVAVVVFKTSPQVAITNPALVNWKPTSNIIQVQMVRPGPKSFVIQCLETQRTWPSMREAAKDLGINPMAISNHLKGKFPDAGGLHFEKLAEI